MRYKARISYDGGPFSGWQVQPGAKTVQGELEGVLQKLFQEKIGVVGCGRTDSGVHARSYYLHFDVPADAFQEEELRHKLNTMTDRALAVHSLSLAPDFHARFDAVSRRYQYDIHCFKDPFLRAYSFYHPPAVGYDLELLNGVAAVLKNYSDFFTFCKSKSDVKTTQCRIKAAFWEVLNTSDLTFHIEADRFLRGMVRLIVGASMLVAEGQLTLGEIEEALVNRRRLGKDWSVPANGLALVAVEYPR